MKKTLKICAVGGALLGGVLALSACGDDVTKVYRTTEEIPVWKLRGPLTTLMTVTPRPSAK